MRDVGAREDGAPALFQYFCRESHAARISNSMYLTPGFWAEREMTEDAAVSASMSRLLRTCLDKNSIALAVNSESHIPEIRIPAKSTTTRHLLCCLLLLVSFTLTVHLNGSKFCFFSIFS